MLIIPTLFLRGEKVANPAADINPAFSHDPFVVAADWQRAGVEMLHVMDLDAGHATGHSPNEAIVARLIRDFGFHCELTGPLRSFDVVKHYFQLGVARVVLGTVAYQQPTFVKSLAQAFPGRIGVEIFVRGSKVIIKGWSAATHKTADEYMDGFRKMGCGAVLYSDVSERGELTPENLTHIRNFALHAEVAVLHNTDLTTVAQIEQISYLEKFGVIGTVLSHSVYSGALDLHGVIPMMKEREHAEAMDESTRIPTEE